MLKSIGNALSLAVVATGLMSIIGATFSRELATLEGMMLWKAGLLALAFFAFRMSEASAPTVVSILDGTALASRD